jgi:hypothetical protein
VKVLLDEMYGPNLVRALDAHGVEAVTAIELGLAGLSDADLLDAAAERGFSLLSENVADFARLASELVADGRHHPGVLIALSSRFSRRPNGIPHIAAAVGAIVSDDLRDRLVFLESVNG